MELVVVSELPVDGHAELEPAGIVALNVSIQVSAIRRPYHTPAAWGGGVEAGLIRLHVIEHVGGIKVKSTAEPLRNSELLAEAEIQVPKRKAADRKGSSLSIQTKDGVAD